MMLISDRCTQSWRPHQSDSSVSFPRNHRIPPRQQPVTKCPFNLHLMAEWHFPFLYDSLLFFSILYLTWYLNVSRWCKWVGETNKTKKLKQQHCVRASVPFCRVRVLFLFLWHYFVHVIFFTMWNSWLINIRVFSSWLHQSVASLSSTFSHVAPPTPCTYQAS